LVQYWEKDSGPLGQDFSPRTRLVLGTGVSTETHVGPEVGALEEKSLVPALGPSAGDPLGQHLELSWANCWGNSSGYWVRSLDSCWVTLGFALGDGLGPLARGRAGSWAWSDLGESLPFVGETLQLLGALSPVMNGGTTGRIHGEELGPTLGWRWDQRLELTRCATDPTLGDELGLALGPALGDRLGDEQVQHWAHSVNTR
jgi:hypothetical protein